MTVTEADGRETHFVQAYAAVPTLLRDGAWRYSATAGQYRNGYVYNQERHPPALFPAGHGGPRHADGFHALWRHDAGAELSILMAGAGKNMRSLGAVSLDLTQARTQQDQGGTLSGQSLRFLYAKSLEQTGTNFRMAGYRYSTSGYRTFPNRCRCAMRRNTACPSPIVATRSASTSRSRWKLGIRVRVGAPAKLLEQLAHGQAHPARLFRQLWPGQLQPVLQPVFEPIWPIEPAGHADAVDPAGQDRATAMYSASRDSNGRVAQQASLFGSAMDDYRLTYGITANQSNQDSSSGSANLNYKGRYGNVTLGRSQARATARPTWGWPGHRRPRRRRNPVPAVGRNHRAGARAKASGVSIESQAGVSTDSAGNAVVPNVTPYRSNRLALVTQDLDDSVDVKYAARDVVPTRGAVVLAPFETSVGYRLMLTLKGVTDERCPSARASKTKQARKSASSARRPGL